MSDWFDELEKEAERRLQGKRAGQLVSSDRSACDLDRGDCPVLNDEAACFCGHTCFLTFSASSCWPTAVWMLLNSAISFYRVGAAAPYRRPKFFVASAGCCSACGFVSGLPDSVSGGQKFDLRRLVPKTERAWPEVAPERTNLKHGSRGRSCVRGAHHWTAIAETTIGDGQQHAHPRPSRPTEVVVAGWGG